MEITKELNIEHHKNIDMDEFVQAKLKTSDYPEELLEGFDEAYEIVNYCMSMYNLGMIGCKKVSIDASPESYALADYLVEYFVNQGMGYVINNGKLLESPEDLREGEMIFVYDQ